MQNSSWTLLVHAHRYHNWNGRVGHALELVERGTMLIFIETANLMPCRTHAFVSTLDACPIFSYPDNERATLSHVSMVILISWHSEFILIFSSPLARELDSPTSQNFKITLSEWCCSTLQYVLTSPDRLKMLTYIRSYFFT
jgi:hypothetical protein